MQVEPGFSEKTVLTFKGLGDQVPKQEPGNLVVRFSQADHARFRRHGDNLIHTVSISFADALKITPVHVRTLDNRSLTVCFDEVVSPQTIRSISGEGMPVAEQTTEMKLLAHSQLPRGDLFVRFDIQMPTNLSHANKCAIIELLKQNEAELAIDEESD